VNEIQLFKLVFSLYNTSLIELIFFLIDTDFYPLLQYLTILQDDVRTFNDILNLKFKKYR